MTWSRGGRVDETWTLCRGHCGVEHAVLVIEITTMPYQMLFLLPTRTKANLSVDQGESKFNTSGCRDSEAASEARGRSFGPVLESSRVTNLHQLSSLPLLSQPELQMNSLRVPDGHFNLLYFASAASYTNKSNETWQAPLTLNEVLEKLEEMYPGIKVNILDHCAITVNLEYVDKLTSNLVLNEGDEVALIPPVSSG
jgi:molybdopterin synthase sulfur carrier subunit